MGENRDYLVCTDEEQRYSVPRLGPCRKPIAEPTFGVSSSKSRCHLTWRMSGSWLSAWGLAVCWGWEPCWGTERGGHHVLAPDCTTGMLASVLKPELHNHRIMKAEKALQDLQTQSQPTPPCPMTTSPSATSPTPNTSRDGNSLTSQGSLCHCITSLWETNRS